MKVAPNPALPGLTTQSFTCGDILAGVRPMTGNAALTIRIVQVIQLPVPAEYVYTAGFHLIYCLMANRTGLGPGLL